METAKVINEVNGVDLDVLFATVQAIAEDPALGKSRFRARNQWVGGSRNTTRVEGFYAGGEERRHQQTFAMEADEPPLLAGADRAPNPVEHLLHALASCVTTSIVAHAAVKGIEIDALEAELEGDIDLNGFLGLDAEAPKGYTDIRVNYRVKTSEENLRRLQQLVQFSPVYNTLVNGVNVDVGLVRA
ncbi:MAG: OsmC family peroxiredoxin [Xanthomonadales bacterium]|nr:OsmC family peroxiredoxin [Xanthomonadales bacterium]NIN58879.1 OsmC family peroxiredoxin [Xanthomonadales bacterium]NIN74148.1 OsmC family peroxiredoxin [Xanthomonadales bacterium]NIO13819.1 OsmC family peroxiredoxin [Xanthomonadales bacterium]NIP11272.1 OsmC family peroxiredoxin [Xanthomonadales bacterium]